MIPLSLYDYNYYTHAQYASQEIRKGGAAGGAAAAGTVHVLHRMLVCPSVWSSGGLEWAAMMLDDLLS